MSGHVALCIERVIVRVLWGGVVPPLDSFEKERHMLGLSLFLVKLIFCQRAGIMWTVLNTHLGDDTTLYKYYYYYL